MHTEKGEVVNSRRIDIGLKVIHADRPWTVLGLLGNEYMSSVLSWSALSCICVAVIVYYMYCNKKKTAADFLYESKAVLFFVCLFVCLFSNKVEVSKDSQRFKVAKLVEIHHSETKLSLLGIKLESNLTWRVLIRTLQFKWICLHVIIFRVQSSMFVNSGIETILLHCGSCLQHFHQNLNKVEQRPLSLSLSHYFFHHHGNHHRHLHRPVAVAGWITE